MSSYFSTNSTHQQKQSSDCSHYGFFAAPWVRDPSGCFRLVCGYLDLDDIVQLSMTSKTIHESLTRYGVHYPRLQIHEHHDFTIPLEFESLLLRPFPFRPSSSIDVSEFDDNMSGSVTHSNEPLNFDFSESHHAIPWYRNATSEDVRSEPLVHSATPYSSFIGGFQPVTPLRAMRLSVPGTNRSPASRKWFRCSLPAQRQWLGRLIGVEELTVDVDVTGQRGIEPSSLARILSNNRNSLRSVTAVWRPHSSLSRVRQISNRIAEWWDIPRDESFLNRMVTVNMAANALVEFHTSRAIPNISPGSKTESEDGSLQLVKLYRSRSLHSDFSAMQRHSRLSGSPNRRRLRSEAFTPNDGSPRDNGFRYRNSRVWSYRLVGVAKPALIRELQETDEDEIQQTDAYDRSSENGTDQWQESEHAEFQEKYKSKEFSSKEFDPLKLVGKFSEQKEWASSLRDPYRRTRKWRKSHILHFKVDSRLRRQLHCRPLRLSRTKIRQCSKTFEWKSENENMLSNKSRRRLWLRTDEQDVASISNGTAFLDFADQFSYRTLSKLYPPKQNDAEYLQESEIQETSNRTLPVIVFPFLETLSLQLFHQYASEFFSGCRFPVCTRFLVEELSPIYDPPDGLIAGLPTRAQRKAIQLQNGSASSLVDPPPAELHTSPYQPISVHRSTAHPNSATEPTEGEKLLQPISHKLSPVGPSHLDIEPDRLPPVKEFPGSSSCLLVDLAPPALSENSTFLFHGDTGKDGTVMPSKSTSSKQSTTSFSTVLFNGDHLAHWFELLESMSCLTEAHLMLGGQHTFQRKQLEPFASNLRRIYRTVLQNNAITLCQVSCNMPDWMSQEILRAYYRFNPSVAPLSVSPLGIDNAFKSLIHVDCDSGTINLGSFALNIILELPHIRWSCKSVRIASPTPLKTLDSFPTQRPKTFLKPASSREVHQDDEDDETSSESVDSHCRFYRPELPHGIALLERWLLRLLSPQIERVVVGYISEELTRTFSPIQDQLQRHAVQAYRDDFFDLLLPPLHYSSRSLDSITSRVCSSSSNRTFLGPLAFDDAAETRWRSTTDARSPVNERASVTESRKTGKKSEGMFFSREWPDHHLIEKLHGKTLNIGMIEALTSSLALLPNCIQLDIQIVKSLSPENTAKQFSRMVSMFRSCRFGYQIRSRPMEMKPRLRVFACPDTPAEVFAALPKFTLGLFSSTALSTLLSSRPACKQLRGFIGNVASIISALQTIRSKLFKWQRPKIKTIEVWVSNVMVRCLCSLRKLIVCLDSYRKLTELRIYPRKLPGFLCPDDVFCFSSPEGHLLGQLLRPMKFQRDRLCEVEVRGLYDLSMFVFTRPAGLAGRLFRWKQSINL